MCTEKTVYLAVAAAVIFFTDAAFAITTTWQNAGGGLWSVGSNWSQGVPLPGDTADIRLSGTYTVTVDQSVAIAYLYLGSLAAHAHLLIPAPHVFSCGETYEAAIIGTNGMLENESLFLVTTDEEYSIESYGRVILRSGSVLDLNDNRLRGNPGCKTILEGGSIVDHCLSIEHDDSLIVDGSTAIVVGDIVIQPSGLFIVDGDLSCYNLISNGGNIEMRPHASIFLDTPAPDVIASDLLLYSGATLFMKGDCSIDGSQAPSYGDYSEVWTDAGTVQVSIDTSSAFDNAYIDNQLSISIEEGFLNIATGNLILGYLSDFTGEISIAAQCTLLTVGGSISGTTAGAGTIKFAADTTIVTGNFLLTGGIIVRSQGPLYETHVEFQPSNINPAMNMLWLGTNYTFFTIDGLNSLTVDTLYQNNGIVNGEVILNETYVWNGGTQGAQDDDLAIPPGVTLSVSGATPKTLDSIDLNIDGSATMSGTGLFTLVDSAVVNVTPAGTLDVGPNFNMVGVGTFYNSGEATFDPLITDVLIDVPVINTTIARTPGTIEILSRTVTFGEGGSNEGDIKVLGDGELIIDGEEAFKNEGTITFEEGTELGITTGSTTENWATGSVEMSGGTTVSGEGTFENGGGLESHGTVLLTSGNVLVEVDLINLADTGFVDVLDDTLTLAGDVSNFGSINIHPGAVLKITGNFVNESGGTIGGGGVLNITDAISFVNNGIISPGSSPGSLTILGDVTLGAQSHINMELTGASLPLNEYDRLLVDGSIVFGGTLNLILQDYIPTPSDTQRLFSYESWSEEFDEITGTDLGNGQYLEIAYGPNEIKNYVCTGGDAEISTGVASVDDTVQLTVTSVDSIIIDICNTGHCPLDYTSQLVNLSPATPAWITIADLATDIVIREHCSQLLLIADFTGLSIGNYSADLEISSNDPVTPLVSIPLNFTVVHGPDLWDIGGGANDFASFSAAVVYLNGATISFPQIFNVYPGTYNEAVTINQVSGASATNTILFRAQNPANHPVISASGAFALRLLGADHTKLDGIDVTRTGSGAGVAVLDTASADSNVFRNMKVTVSDSTNNSAYGLAIARATVVANRNDGNLIENVQVHGSYYGIVLGRQIAPISGRNNVVSNCLVANAIYGVLILSQRAARIENCVVHAGYSGVALNVFGIRIYALNAGDTVSVVGNELSGFISTAGGYGIDAEAANLSSLVRIYNNMVHGFESVQGYPYGILVRTDTHAEVHFNTVRMNTPVTAISVWAMHVQGIGTTVMMTNNILMCEATSYSVSISRDQSVLTSDHNCVYGTGPNYKVGRNGLTSYTTLADWQTAMSQDTNSIQADPGFFSPTDLHIDGFVTACDSNAFPVSGITTDFDDQLRNATHPDIGADEYTGIYDSIDSLTIIREFGTSNVKLNWEDIAGAQSYVIYSGTTSGFALSSTAIIDTVSTSSFTHLGVILASDAPQFYRVRASGIPLSSIVNRMQRGR